MRLNGTLIYQDSGASLGTAGVSTIQIGNDTAAQAFSLVADTVSVQDGGTTASPPVNTALPTISGTAPDRPDVDREPGELDRHASRSTYAYQWRRCDTSGADCAAISATGSSYAATDDDVGATLRVRRDRDQRRRHARPPPPTATAVVQSSSSPPVNTALPTISGTAQDGRDADREPGQLDRDAADHLRLPVAALRLERRQLRRDLRRHRLQLRGDAARRRKHPARGRHRDQLRRLGDRHVQPDRGGAGGSAWPDLQRRVRVGRLLAPGRRSRRAVTARRPCRARSSAPARSRRSSRETANAGSKAYVRKTFASAQQDLTASGDFRVLQQGASGGNVPFFRFLDPASARIVSVYRQNGTGGKIGLTYGGHRTTRPPGAAAQHAGATSRCT